MKNLSSVVLFLVLAVLIQSPLRAQEGTPVPVDADMNNTTPPALPDLNQLDLPVIPGSTPSSQPQAAPEAPAPVVDTPTAIIQMPPPPVPTPTKIISLPQSAAVIPTPTLAPKVSMPVAAVSTAPASAAPAVAAQTGGISDYFPWVQGQSLNYEYLKSAGAKKTQVVECLQQETMPNGTVHFTLKITEGAQVVQDKYSLLDNRVEHTFAGKMALTGHVLLRLPEAGQAALWQLKGGDGLTHAYKASFGQAQVYQKVYPDCVVVTDKALSGGKPVSTRISYYAKGIGLVALEVYSSGMKLIQTESLALVQPGQ
jgi:hypothetical protein